MNEISNSCKVRNQVVEISFIESLLYKNYFKCKRIHIRNNQLSLIQKCDDSLNRLFYFFTNELDTSRCNHNVCLIRCTDKLLIPSEELTCYDQCEENYNHKLKLIKKKLYDELNQII